MPEPLRYNYSRERVTLHPRGARPRAPSISGFPVNIDSNTIPDALSTRMQKVTPPRRTLPAVPPPARALTVTSTQSARRIRPLPYRPSNLRYSSSSASSSDSSSSASSSSSPLSSSSFSSLSSSSTLSTPLAPTLSTPLSPITFASPSPSPLLPTLFASRAAWAGVDNSSSFGIGPVEFVRPKIRHSDSDCRSDSDGEEAGTVAVKPYQQNNKSIHPGHPPGGSRSGDNLLNINRRNRLRRQQKLAYACEGLHQYP